MPTSACHMSGKVLNCVIDEKYIFGYAMDGVYHSCIVIFNETVNFTTAGRFCRNCIIDGELMKKENEAMFFEQNHFAWLEFTSTEFWVNFSTLSNDICLSVDIKTKQMILPQDCTNLQGFACQYPLQMNCGFIQVTSNVSKYSSDNCSYNVLTKMQQSPEKDCGTDKVDIFKIDSAYCNCMVRHKNTDWEPWSPCSKTCETCNTSRIRTLSSGCSRGVRQKEVKSCNNVLCTNPPTVTTISSKNGMTLNSETHGTSTEKKSTATFTFVFIILAIVLATVGVILLVIGVASV